MIACSEKKEHSIILGITIGSLLEWYEIYLYIYWAPIISSLFFGGTSDSSNLLNTFFLFGIGFLARPLGGLFFGRLGDKVGRKKAFILSIVMMSLPTFIMGILPGYATLGIGAPILLGILRILQAFPAGGELPGAFCYLYESVAHRHRRYMTSWGAVGNQIGIIISMIECFLLEKWLTHEQLISWGWRLSFVLGGLIGLLGFYLRYKLQETPLYRDIEKHKQISKEPLLEVIGRHKSQIGIGICFCLFNSVGFYLMSVLFPIYFEKIINISFDKNLTISMVLLALTTIPIPFIGALGDRVDNKKLLVYSTIGMIILIYPLYLLVNDHSHILTAFVSIIFILLFTVLTALLPYRFANLFTTPVRFTGVGLSYNIVDSIAGGFSPVFTLFLLNQTGTQLPFYCILLLSAFVSLFSFLRIKERN